MRSAVTTDMSYRARLVLLGASNLTRGISTAVETARLTLGSPLEIIAALGHGRSFGMQSTMLLRTIPGILQSNFFDALAERCAAGPRLKTHAVITDIGNDVMYGAPPHVIAGWVEQCINRIRACVEVEDGGRIESGGVGGRGGPSIVMALLPMDSIRRTRPGQFAVVKSLLFPTRAITFEQAMSKAEDLHQLLLDLAKRTGVRTIQPRREWYGFDPIHIRMRRWRAAWRETFSACGEAVDIDQAVRGSLLRWMRLRRAMPERFAIAGKRFTRSQPALTLPEGTTLWLY